PLEYEQYAAAYTAPLPAGTAMYINNQGQISYMNGSKYSYTVIQNSSNRWLFTKVGVNNQDWVHLDSRDVTVTFDPGANQLVTPRLAMFFRAIMNMAHSDLGVNSVNISSTTNHPTNAARSMHSRGLAFDINYINGVHVTNNPKSSIYGIEYDLFGAVLDSDDALNEQYLEYYSPGMQQRWTINGNTVWPSVAPEHQTHIHISLQ
ncbi:MAG: hypothetical protein JWR09_3209, partial [Mucilaginibacter sp.]|nr:hypothetical protein [Mucilaginibacter sp.]